MLRTLLCMVVLFFSACDLAPQSEPIETEASSLVCLHSYIAWNGVRWVRYCDTFRPSTFPDSRLCDSNDNPGLRAGEAAVYTGPSFTGTCDIIRAENYLTLGDWDAYFHVNSIKVGPQAYFFAFSEPNLISFTNFYGPGTEVADTTIDSLSSIELVLGQ